MDSFVAFLADVRDPKVAGLLAGAARAGEGSARQKLEVLAGLTEALASVACDLPPDQFDRLAEQVHRLAADLRAEFPADAMPTRPPAAGIEPPADLNPA